MLVTSVSFPSSTASLSAVLFASDTLEMVCACATGSYSKACRFRRTPLSPSRFAGFDL